MKQIVYLLIVSLMLLSCQADKKTSEYHDELVVFAAASLSDVMMALCDSFQVKHHVKVKLNLASSGTLARQIEHGMLSDVYISANEYWVDYLDTMDLLSASDPQVIAYNDLVLIAPKGELVSNFSLENAAQVLHYLADKRLAIGNPLHVPAGMYAKQALVYYGLYRQLEKQLLKAQNVRAVLRNVEMGEAALGLVYRTDALKSTKVRMLSELSNQSHQPIRYVACHISTQEQSKAFVHFMQSECSLPVWEKYGFRK